MITLTVHQPIPFRVHHVYVYVDPRMDEPFYVGKGMGERFIQHINRAAMKSNRPVSERLKAITEAGFRIEVYIVAENLTSGRAIYLEGFYIDALGRLNDPQNPGPLVNVVRSGGGAHVGYRGVQKKKKRFKTHISRAGRNLHLGYYDDAEYAARIVDQALVERDGEKVVHHRLNFPDEWEGTTCLRPLLERNVAQNTGQKTRDSSKYIGVQRASKSWMRRVKYSKGWLAVLQIDGKHKRGGPYELEATAARKRDELAIKYHGPRAILNFPDEWEGLECLRMSVNDARLRRVSVG